MGQGRFITLEGGEGVGKSTQARLLAERLGESGHAVLTTREPGGSKKAEEIREFLLAGKARAHGALGEAMLFNAARESHLEETIRPALDEGKWVVCDRFSDSTRVYQGTAGGVSLRVLMALERNVVEPTYPDLTIILDLPAATGLERAKAASDGDDEASAGDDFEARDIGFHEAIRQGFLDVARHEPGRCIVIDAQQTVSAVAEDVWEAVVEHLQP